MADDNNALYRYLDNLAQQIRDFGQRIDNFSSTTINLDSFKKQTELCGNQFVVLEKGIRQISDTIEDLSDRVAAIEKKRDKESGARAALEKERKSRFRLWAILIPIISVILSGIISAIIQFVIITKASPQQIEKDEQAVEHVIDEAIPSKTHEHLRLSTPHKEAK